MITEAESRYLMAIYDCYSKGIYEIGPKHLAQIMDVKRPTAYEMLNRLKEKGIMGKKNGKYCLTQDGLIIAKRIIRNHRIIETMLYKAGVELEKACKVASKIQLEMDSDVVDIICEYLGNPKECPHGRPIPEESR